MNCERFHDLLDAYRRNELPPEMASEVEEHLRKCESCSVYAEEADRLGQILRSVTPSEPAPAYFEELARRVRHEVERPARSRILDIASWFAKPRALAWAAAAALVVFGAFSLLIHTENKRENTTLQAGRQIASRSPARSAIVTDGDLDALQNKKTEIASAAKGTTKYGLTAGVPVVLQATPSVAQAAPASEISNAPAGPLEENRGAPVQLADRKKADTNRELFFDRSEVEEAKVALSKDKSPAKAPPPPASQPVPASGGYAGKAELAPKGQTASSSTQLGSPSPVFAEFADALDARALNEDSMKATDKELPMPGKRVVAPGSPAGMAGRELAAVAPAALAAPAAPSASARDEGKVRQRRAGSFTAEAPRADGAYSFGGFVNGGTSAASPVAARMKMQEVTTATASTLFLDAEDARLSGRYEDAIALYRRAANEAPATSLAAHAMLRIADVTFENLHNNQSARQAYEKCLTESFRPFFSQDELQAIRARLDQLRPQI